MKYHQTDSEFNTKINKYGCLWFQLMNIAEQYTGHSFIIKTINKLYDHLTTTSFEIDNKEFLLMDEDCYINSHTKVLQDILEVFECHDKVTYVGAWYNDNETDRKSWGKRYGMYMILQMRTKNGNGHFTSMHYDSYLPEIQFKNLISVRYYNIGV